MTDETETMSVIAGRLEDLFNAAHQDPELKRRLLSQPAEVAKEWNVQLDKRDVERLTKIGVFAEIAREIRVGSLFRVGDPTVWYASQFWLQQEVIGLISDLTYPDLVPSTTIQSKLDRTLYLGGNPGGQGRN